jgi:hypothetical protein
MFSDQSSAFDDLPKIHIEPNEVEFDETMMDALNRLHGEFAAFEERFKKGNECVAKAELESLRGLLNNADDKIFASLSRNKPQTSTQEL